MPWLLGSPAVAPDRLPSSTPSRATQAANTNGKPGQFLPRLAQIDLMFESLRLFADHLVTDEQDRLRLAPESPAWMVMVEADKLGPPIVHASASSTRARATDEWLCVSQASTSISCNRHLAEDAHGEGRAVASDPAAGEDADVFQPLDIDDWQQRDVELICAQAVHQLRREHPARGGHSPPNPGHKSAAWR
jgi:hypothetical protein